MVFVSKAEFAGKIEDHPANLVFVSSYISTCNRHLSGKLDRAMTRVTV